jgi:hypothetical protein
MHTIPYSKNYIKFTQNNITYPFSHLPPPFTTMLHINTEASTLHTYNICTCEGNTNTACGNNGQARGKVSTRVNKQNITLITTLKTISICGFFDITDCRQNITTGLHGKTEPLQCKQPKKGTLLRQVDDAPYEVELGVIYN